MMLSWRSRGEGFSEFTYGFALTNELVNVGNPPILSAPIFPSLIAEGRAGGYDVMLDRPGKPIFIQFKLSRLIRGRRAMEFQRREFWTPFYRMAFRARARSWQHELLVDLESQNGGGVFYIAPAFHLLSQLNAHYERRQIVMNSRRVRPSEANIPDDQREHWLSFQRASGGDVFLHSEEGGRVELDERPFADVIAEQLRSIDRRRPLVEVLQSVSAWFREMEMPQLGRMPIERSDATPAVLIHVAETSQLALGCTVFFLQERERRA